MLQTLWALLSLCWTAGLTDDFANEMHSFQHHHQRQHSLHAAKRD